MDQQRQRVIVEMRVPAAAEGDAIPTFAAGQIAAAGFEIDPTYPAVAAPPAGAEATAAAGPGEKAVVLRGTVTPADLKKLRSNPMVINVYSDGTITAFADGVFGPPDLELTLAGAASPCAPFDCDASGSAEGDLAAMARALGADAVWAAGYTGVGIVIGVCDTGVHASDIPALIDGWSPPGGSPVGDNGAHYHGTMCATDALGSCPDAKIYDIGILKSQGGLSGLLSDAIAAYDWALNRYRLDGTPQVLTNSWGIYQRSWIPDYACDGNHIFCRKVIEVIDAGMLVAFAAGNCGEVCPSSRCGGDVGPGKSIWGANGLERMITVGAANVHDEWVGYTSQGPSCISERKPDVCGISHFQGYTPLDNGTSAACPTVAGVLGLLRQAKPALGQDDARAALMSTARDLCSSGWDRNSGAGIVNARAALAALAGAPAAVAVG